jgi:hypothetical protein
MIFSPHSIPAVRELLQASIYAQSRGQYTTAAEHGRKAILTLCEALGVSERGLGTVLAVLEDAEFGGDCAQADYERAHDDGRVVVERAELLERLVSDREEYFSPERDLRAHDSHARRAG